MYKQYSFLNSLICSRCGKKYDPSVVQTVCSCGGPLLTEYDLASINENVSPQDFAKRSPNLWRYHELLPVVDEKNVVTLGEGMTPMLRAKTLENKLDLNNLYIKDEGILPTGTFKARGAAVGLSKAKELGIRKISMPTNGNAGAAWATYAARAGITSVIVMPKDAPKITRCECYAAGSRLYLVDGLISDAGAIVKKASEKYGLFDVSTLKEPYRLEGKKTMGLEILEQLDWKAPDVIIYPTGGGVGIIGIYKAMKELKEMGWIDEISTRLVSVQAEGCAPIVKAWEQKKSESEFWKNSETIAFGINVPKALGDFLVLDAIYKTNGSAVAISDREIIESQLETARKEGLFMCPEGAATIAAARKLRNQGWIDKNETVVALNTGSGLKYPEVLDFNAPLLRPEEELSL